MARPHPKPYACPDCLTLGEQPGNCYVCDKPMVQVVFNKQRVRSKAETKEEKGNNELPETDKLGKG